MSRTIIPMEVADLSAFAKSVREKFSALDHKPSHVEVLNLLSKAAGFRNFQHLRDKQQRAEVIQAWNINADPVPPPVAVLPGRLHRPARGWAVPSLRR